MIFDFLYHSYLSVKIWEQKINFIIYFNLSYFTFIIYFIKLASHSPMTRLCYHHQHTLDSHLTFVDIYILLPLTKNYSNSGSFNHWTKRFKEINIQILMKFLGYEMCLILLNCSIWIPFNSKDSFTSHIQIRRWWYEVPCLISNHSIIFIIHSLFPRRSGQNIFDPYQFCESSANEACREWRDKNSWQQKILQNHSSI